VLLFGFHSNSPIQFLSVPSIYSVLALLPTVRFRSFLASSRDMLSMPPSASVSGQYAIGFLPLVIILIVCFSYFSFSCFFRFCLYLFVFPLLFPYTFSTVCSFYLVVFPFLSIYFLVRFFFPVFACNKALSS
jgi:hypothetical protein